MAIRLPTVNDVVRLAREFESVAARGADEARAWLVTPRGRQFRALAARFLIVAAPVITRSRLFKTPVGRLIELAGGAAFVVKLGEILRDWEPQTGSATNDLPAEP